MYTIQVIDNLSKKGLSYFDEGSYKVGSEFSDPDVILVRSSKLHDYNFSAGLKAIGRAGIGTDNIPVERLTDKGIPVFFAPGANANAVKELVLAALLIGYRNLDQARSFLHDLASDNKEDLNHEIEAKKKQFVGREISGKTLGVIGLGNIGVKVANAALALGMNIIAYDPYMSLNNALALMPGIKITQNLSELLTNSDIVTLHVPLMSNTTHLINDENIHLLKNNAMLMNFSREKVVAQETIVKHLNNQALMSYITDFPTVELANHPRVLCFPHLGASTVEAEENSATMVVKNIKNYLEQGSIDNAVNFPRISLPYLNKPGIKRILIMNRNKKGIIAEITSILSNYGYNIEQMVNTSLDNVSANLIDVIGQNVSADELIDKLTSIKDIVKARLITLG